MFFLCFCISSKLWNLPTSQGKNKQALKNKTASACCMDVKLNKNLINFIYQWKKCKMENNDKINREHYITFAIIIRLKENSIKRCFYRNFLLFVLQLSCFKTYPHADEKQRKTKKWPYVVLYCKESIVLNEFYNEY